MPTDPLFRLTVEDVFAIRGRGTVVTGTIESGTLHTGDVVFFEKNGAFKNAQVKGIESFHKVLSEAGTADNVGVLLGDLGPKDIQKGDVLTGSGAEL